MTPVMLRHEYVAAGPQIRMGGRDDPDQQTILDALTTQALSDRQSSLAEVERALQETYEGASAAAGDDAPNRGGADHIIKSLKDRGYLKDGKKWLTRRGFEYVGNAILKEIMKNADPQDPGAHHTGKTGAGEWVLDTTRRPEPGDDILHMSAQDTLLNAARRGPPLRITYDDIEEFETDADSRAAIVYCIDLSSTMKTKMGGTSRIKAAKKALWGLYTANTKYFAQDSIHIVGFASMAGSVDPRDIPYLRAFDAADFLHYTNYQAALRLARRILAAEPVRNKRIILITDGQPSACYVESDHQRDTITAKKPYANFYSPQAASDTIKEKGMRPDAAPGRQVYLCYRYKKVDSHIHRMTLLEGQRCRREHIGMEIVTISDETELIQYAANLAGLLGGNAFHIQEDMGKLVTSYMRGHSKTA